MNARSLLVLSVLTVGLAACGATVDSAAGGDARGADTPTSPVPALVPPVVPVEAALPDDMPDRVAFKPVPTPVQPPSPKPIRSQPTPPPDRQPPGVPLPDPSLVSGAIADLADRLGIRISLIEVLDARPVTWRDGSVGCPEEGLAYSQAEVPGSLVVLRVDDVSYRYHAAEGTRPFLCETPQSPLEGSA